MLYIVKYESLGADLYDYITSIQVEGRPKFLELYYDATVPVDVPLYVLKSYINSVDRATVQGIQLLYGLDFQLFDYTFR